MSLALSNEDRFIASCMNEGEVGVRQKLNAGRYSERRAVWAGTWLDEVESGKSDATKAEERSRSLLKPKAHNGFFAAALAVVFVLVALGAAAFVVST